MPLISDCLKISVERMGIFIKCLVLQVHATHFLSRYNKWLTQSMTKRQAENRVKAVRLNFCFLTDHVAHALRVHHFMLPMFTLMTVARITLMNAQRPLLLFSGSPFLDILRTPNLG